MENLNEGRTLAETMTSIARMAGRKAVALLSDMNQPLGCAVGNALEVKEAIDTLQGRGPADFKDHCLTLAMHMLILGGKAEREDEAMALAVDALESGKAWDYFRILVDVQEGDLDAVDHPEQLPKARWIETTPAPRSAYLAGVHARLVGETAVMLGAGRTKKDDPIDPAVGVVVHHKVGDWVQFGQPLFTLHASDALKMGEARRILLEAHTWSDKPVQPLPLFYEVIRS
jgi:pyrimidine-nucleoside phosphorylase